MNIDVKRLPHFDSSLPLPSYETPGSAGADIRACFEERDNFTLMPGKKALIPTGLAFAIPPGYEIQVRPRSGIAYKTGLMILNAPGTIDSDYRGEIKILVGNLGEKNEIIHHGDRLAQLVFVPVIQGMFCTKDDLQSTHRASGGFGSTGIK